MIVKLKTKNASVRIPAYSHGPAEDAGMDLYADETVYLRPNEPEVVKTGLFVELPPGCEAQIRSRSGLALKYGIVVLNSPGTIDPAYRGEIGVILCWNGHKQVGDQPFLIEKGMRIAQMVGVVPWLRRVRVYRIKVGLKWLSATNKTKERKGREGKH